jgi:hypothetical protein
MEEEVPFLSDIEACAFMVKHPWQANALSLDDKAKVKDPFH